MAMALQQEPQPQPYHRQHEEQKLAPPLRISPLPPPNTSSTGPKPRGPAILPTEDQIRLGMGPDLPEDLREQFVAAIDTDDIVSLTSLLDTHFTDRTNLFPGGVYRAHHLQPMLMAAARQGRADMVALLLQYPTLRATHKFVAEAAFHGRATKTLKVLLDDGWDVNETADPVGVSFVARVIKDEDWESRTDSESKPESAVDMIAWLVEHGADLNARPFVDITPMSMAAKHAPPAFVGDLLDKHGGDVNRGQLLHYALDRADDKIVETLGVLLERGAPLNAVMYADDRRSSGMYPFMDFGTPLHKAVQKCKSHLSVIEYLLAQGADTGILSMKGETALEWAEKEGDEEVVALLRSPDQYRL